MTSVSSVGTTLDLPACTPASFVPRRHLANGPELDGYLVPRINYFMGHLVRHSGWANDRLMRFFHRDRGRYVGDTDFVTVPVEKLTSKGDANGLRQTIQLDKASPSQPAQIADGNESLETTHFSVVDKSGMAVSVTYTLEAGYGLGAVVAGAG